MISTRLAAQTSPASAFRDAGELAYYEGLKKLVEDDAAVAALPEKLGALSRKIFDVTRLDLMFVGEEGEEEVFRELAEGELALLPAERAESHVLFADATYENEGVVTAGKVQYVAKGGNFRDHGYEFTGAMTVLETVLRYEYLWTRVRVQGGAYGAFANFYRNGDMIFCSYRDPNLSETLRVYDEMPDWLASVELSDRELRKYIIGTMSGLDLPLTPALRGPRAMGLYFRGVTENDQESYRREVIATTAADIAALAAPIRAVMADNRIVVMGNEQRIRAEESLFANISNL